METSGDDQGMCDVGVSPESIINDVEDEADNRNLRMPRARGGGGEYDYMIELRMAACARSMYLLPVLIQTPAPLLLLSLYSFFFSSLAVYARVQ